MRALTLCLLLSSVVPTPSALAKPTEGTHVSRSVRKRAERYFRRGRRLYRKEKFQRAVEAFKKAWDLLPNKNILMNLSICYAEMEAPLRAIAYLRQAERMAGRSAEEILDKRGYAKLLALRKKVAVLMVEVDDPRAVVVINREPAGSSPVEKILYPARHRIAVQVDGVTRRERTIDLRAGAEEKWIVRLRTGGGGDPGDPGRRAWQRLHLGWALGAAALTVVASAALLGTGLKTNALVDEYGRTGSPAVLREGQRYKQATNALIGVTAVAGVTAVVLAVFTRWRRRGSSQAIRIDPILGPGTAGLGLQGRF